MIKRNHKNLNRYNAINNDNSCEAAIKGLRSEINKEGINKIWKERKYHIKLTRKRYEQNKTTAIKRKNANRRNKYRD
ncbi:MAG: 30S ribosomal protein S21 [Pseudomonadota bacterium]